ncbi:MAG: hydantoinase/oxoprolinase family protein [Nitrososphaerota archaeon]
MSRIRIGIDVGGTFTKGVAIDAESYRIIGKAAVLTTHYAPEGVARGIIEVFNKLINEFSIDPESVSFVAHSTTQATNALLEGDVEPVGLIAIGKGISGIIGKRQLRIDEVPISTTSSIKVKHIFINYSSLNEEVVRQNIKSLMSAGAKSIVASQVFGVDDPSGELLVMKVAEQLGIPCTASHEISKLYGLTVRTRTAIINASLLPKMIETANMTESSMRKVGIKSHLMVMKGDGGVMSIDEMRKRPIFTALSGPAASVAGALLYLRVTDGVFFEVGGTSTNIGVIRNGKPQIKYVDIGGHRTYLNSLDVRVLGIAGGSMVRVKDKKIIDVGPRSAHIAGLPYSAFAKTEEIKNPKLIYIQPRRGDPNDYVAIKTTDGKIFAVTTTCAANALEIVKPGDYPYGNPEAAREAIKPLAQELGVSVEEASKAILEKAAMKVTPVIDSLIKEYKLERENVILVGGGGGAAALVPFISKISGLEYKISDNAEVISSIGDALAMVQEIVERIIPFPKREDILIVKNEAVRAAIKSGAQPTSVKVYTEVDPHTFRVRAVATGSVDIMTQDLMRNITEDEAKSIAAASMHISSDKVKLIGKLGTLFVLTDSYVQEQPWFISGKIRIIDQKGFIRLRKEKGLIMQSKIANIKESLKRLWDYATIFSDALIYPDIFVVMNGNIVDLSGMIDFDHVLSLLEAELEGANPTEDVILIAIRKRV